jgi:hypothetical protein
MWPGISGITKHALLAHIRLLERVARWSAFLQSSRSVHSRWMLSRIQMNNFLPFSLRCLSLPLEPRSPPCVLAAVRRSPVVYVWWGGRGLPALPGPGYISRPAHYKEIRFSDK